MYRPLEHTLGPRPDRSFPEWYHTCPAVRDERGEEIAVVTLRGYTVGTEATPRQWADLFAAAPQMLAALKTAAAEIEQLCSTVNTCAEKAGLGRKVRAEDFGEKVRAVLAELANSAPHLLAADDPRELASPHPMLKRAVAAGWKFGGDAPGFWFHESTWGTWKAAASWAGTDQAPNGPNDHPAIYDTLDELCAGEELESDSIPPACL